ncbi:hypothetical protein RJ640_023420, partial [Escallonia rubra]
MVDVDQQQQRHQQDLLIGTYFLELWRQNSRASMTSDAQRKGENEDMEDDPTELDTVNSSGGFSVVFPDKLTVQEIMHAMWKLQKFKYSYFIATIYVFTLTLPSASAMYWAFGDQFLNHSNAFALLPKTRWRDTAVIHMLIHQMIDYCSIVSSPALSLLILVPVNCAVFVFLTEIEWRNVVLVAQFITFGFACTPFYFVWEKVIGMHDTRSICLRALARLPVLIPIWFLAIISLFLVPSTLQLGLSWSFSPSTSFPPLLICSPTGKPLLDRRSQYSIMDFLYHGAFAITLNQEGHIKCGREAASFLRSWTAMYAINTFIVIWIFVVGFGFGGWASIRNRVKQVDTFGLFAKCYRCKPPAPTASLRRLLSTRPSSAVKLRPPHF